jgi:hypothetical protein
MSGISLFPPQVISDLNFFNVSSKEDAAFRLRTLQRVALAAVGAYLVLRYESKLTAPLGNTLTARLVVRLGLMGFSCCLSAPSAVLAWTGFYGIIGVSEIISAIVKKEVGVAVYFLLGTATVYSTFQKYSDSFFMEAPNLLERVFQKVEDRYAEPLWNRFYKPR